MLRGLGRKQAAFGCTVFRFWVVWGVLGFFFFFNRWFLKVVMCKCLREQLVSRLVSQ